MTAPVVDPAALDRARALGRAVAAGEVTPEDADRELAQLALDAPDPQAALAELRDELAAANIDATLAGHGKRTGGLDVGTVRAAGLGPGEDTDMPRVVLVRASTIEPRPLRWAWEGRIPAGMSTLVAGREGVGKTALIGHLLARLTRGDLPGVWEGCPARVVYVGAEDDPASVLVPRLLAAGADLERVELLAAPAMFTAAAADDLVAALGPCDDLAAVVVDPLDAHLGDRVDTHRKAEVQRVFARLVGRLVARWPACAVIGVAHLSKGERLDALRAVIGSVGFTSTARSVLVVGEHPDDRRDRLVAVRKANHTAADAVAALRFRVEGCGITPPGAAAPITTARVVILGEEHGVDADALVASPTGEERTARAEAREFLAGFLADGPQLVRDVERAAQEEGIARRTLYRAADELGVTTERDEHERGRPGRWTLPRFSANAAGAVWHQTRGTKSEASGIKGRGASGEDLVPNSEFGTKSADPGGDRDVAAAQPPPTPATERGRQVDRVELDRDELDRDPWLRAQIAAIPPDVPDRGRRIARLRAEALRRRGAAHDAAVARLEERLRATVLDDGRRRP